MKKKIILITLTLYLLIGCRDEYGRFDYCANLSEDQDITIPSYVYNNKLYLVFDNSYPNFDSKIEFIPNSILIFDNLKDTLQILNNLNFEGTPLLIQKNNQNKIIIITSKCLYSLDDENKLNKELTFNFALEKNLFKKTLFDYNNGILYFQPGIDNPNNEIFVIDLNNINYKVLTNTPLDLNKNQLIGFCFPNNDGIIEYVFALEDKFYIKTNDSLIIKSLPNNSKIFSISYNNLYQEICLGSNRGDIFYFKNNTFKKNYVNNNIYFPSVSNIDCDKTNITNLNFFNDFYIYQVNYSPKTLEYVIKFNNDRVTTNYNNDENNNYNLIIPYYKGNLKTQFWDSYITKKQSPKYYDEELGYHFEMLFNFSNSDFSLTKLDINFITKTYGFEKVNSNYIQKSFEY